MTTKEIGGERLVFQSLSRGRKTSKNGQSPWRGTKYIDTKKRQELGNVRGGQRRELRGEGSVTDRGELIQSIHRRGAGIKRQSEAYSGRRRRGRSALQSGCKAPVRKGARGMQEGGQKKYNVQENSRAKKISHERPSRFGGSAGAQVELEQPTQRGKRI